ncbi:MAG: class I SAM-dependent methyltransferase [Pseudomonadota bacterium]
MTNAQWNPGSDHGADAVHNDAGLRAFWREFFCDASEQSRVLDIACGEGSATAAVVGKNSLIIGLDISLDALRVFGAGGKKYSVCGRSAVPPLADGGFDFVVSQFGVEYGGGDAFDEAVRLLAPGGRLAFIIHYKGGSIWNEVAGRRAEIEALDTAGPFLGVARSYVAALFAVERGGGSAARAREEAARFKPILAEVQTLAQKPGHHLAAHLVGGVQTLLANRAGYILEDITGWLTQMEKELDAGRARIEAMLTAAQSRESIKAIAARYSEAGLSVSPLDDITLDGRDRPAAWILKAARQAFD